MNASVLIFLYKRGKEAWRKKDMGENVRIARGDFTILIRVG